MKKLLHTLCWSVLFLQSGFCQDSYQDAYDENYYADLDPCSCSEFNLKLEYLSIDVPNFSYGIFIADSTPIPFFNSNDERAQDFYKELSFALALDDYLWCGQKYLELGGFLFSDDNSTFGGPLAFGGAFFLFPISGSGPIISVGDPSIVTAFTFRRDFDYNGVFLKFGTELPFDFLNSCNFQPFFKFQWSNFNETYVSNIAGTFSPGITLNYVSALTESIETNYYDFGLGFDWGYDFYSGLFAYAEIGGYASYVTTDFVGHQVYRPLAILVTTFSNVSENNSTWTGKFKANAGIGYQFGIVDISLDAGYEYWGYIPGITNPSVTGARAALASDTSNLYFVGGKISVPIRL